MRGLMERIQEPMSKLQAMGPVLLESPQGVEVQHNYDGLMAAMQEYERIIVEDWCQQVRIAGNEACGCLSSASLWRIGAST